MLGTNALQMQPIAARCLNIAKYAISVLRGLLASGVARGWHSRPHRYQSRMLGRASRSEAATSHFLRCGSWAAATRCFLQSRSRILIPERRRGGILLGSIPAKASERGEKARECLIEPSDAEKCGGNAWETYRLRELSCLCESASCGKFAPLGC